MRVVVLAGGRGVRLAPLTEVIPKPLVPIGGMPILEFLIRQLEAQGFRRITLAVGYMSELIKAYFQDGSRWGVEIDYSHESEPLGTAGPLALVDGLDDTFLVMNADVLTNIDYNDLIQYHRSRGGIATVAAFERQIKIDLGVIVKNGDGCIRDYVEKPQKNFLVSMGIYVFEPKMLDFIRGRGALDFPDLVRSVLGTHRLYYYPFPGFWLDIGRHDDYSQAASEFEALQEEFGFLPDFKPGLGGGLSSARPGEPPAETAKRKENPPLEFDWVSLINLRSGGKEQMLEVQKAARGFLERNQDLAADPEKVKSVIYFLKNYICVDPGCAELPFREQLERAANMGRAFLGDQAGIRANYSKEGEEHSKVIGG